MSKNNLKKEYQKISLPKNLEESILMKTINKPKRSKNFKLVYASWTILIIALCSITIVYADEIREFFKWKTTLSLDDGTKVEISNNNTFKKINPEFFEFVNISDEIDDETSTQYATINIAKLDKLLGFHILNSYESKLEEINCNINFNKDNTVGIVDLWYSNFIKYNEEKNISMHVRIVNENADEGYILAFEDGIDPTGGKKIVRNYKQKKLDANVIIYTNDWDDTRLSATFVYDNAFYKFTCFNVSIDELIEIIDSLY